MDREQVKVLEAFGYSFAEVKGIHHEPRATLYRVVNGEIMECPDLPVDAFSLQRYLAKGFTLERPQLKSQTVEQSQEGFTCEVCGKSFSTRIALTGHSRSHKNK